MTIDITPELFASVPDADGRFGSFGGKFVAETLMSALSELEALYARLKDDAAFRREFDTDLAHYVGRPSHYTRRLGYLMRLAVAVFILNARISIIPARTK